MHKFSNIHQGLTNAEVARFLDKLSKVKIGNWKLLTASFGGRKFLYDREKQKPPIGITVWVHSSGTIQAGSVIVCECKSLFTNLSKRWGRKERREVLADKRKKEKQVQQALEKIKQV